jgi:hypothetical protein
MMKTDQTIHVNPLAISTRLVPSLMSTIVNIHAGPSSGEILQGGGV